MKIQCTLLSSYVRIKKNTVLIISNFFYSIPMLQLLPRNLEYKVMILDIN